jgi:hypothetical protein
VDVLQKWPVAFRLMRRHAVVAQPSCTSWVVFNHLHGTEDLEECTRWGEVFCNFAIIAILNWTVSAVMSADRRPAPIRPGFPAVRDGVSALSGDGLRAPKVEGLTASPSSPARGTRSRNHANRRRLMLPLAPGFACCLLCDWVDMGTSGDRAAEHARAAVHPVIRRPSEFEFLDGDR